MQICLQIIAQTKTHTLSPEKEHGRWRQGETVRVFERVGAKVRCDNPKFVFVYVDDWQGTLIEAVERYTTAHELDDAIGEKPATPLARCKVNVDFLPADRVSVQRDGQITLTQAEMAGTEREREPRSLDLKPRTGGR